MTKVAFQDPDAEIAYLLGQDVANPQMMGGAYEAADRHSRELATWNPPTRSADGDILPNKVITDARAADMLRNDSFMNAGQALHKDNIVGSMFFLNSKPNTKVLGLDDVWATEFQAEVEAKFTLWAESLNNWPDASRRNNFTDLIRLAVGVYLAGGEVLATVEWMREQRRPFQTAIQMIENSRLSDPGDQAYDFDRTRGGIKFNSYGAPQGYYIRRALPGQVNEWKDNYRWSYVRATNSIGRPQVIHLVEQNRPGQSRGISQLVAAMKEMKMTKDFRDVTLQNAVVNASFAATIESDLPTGEVFASLGGGDAAGGVIDYAGAYLTAVQKFSDSSKNMSMDGAKIPHLLPGSKLNLLPMGTPGGIGSEFESSLLRYVAANLGVSYEQFSKDYSKTNYSSARAGMVETWKYMQSRKRNVADKFASTIFRLWFEEALNLGEITSMPRNPPNFYDGLNMEAYTNCDWIGAGRGQIDELKETQAAILRVKSGLGTFEEELSKQGKDWRVVAAQRKREKELHDSLGLVEEESNAINAASGTVNEPKEDKTADQRPGDNASATSTAVGDLMVSVAPSDLEKDEPHV
jgi:lambda family phage portal protein